MVKRMGDKCECGRPLVFEEKTPPYCPHCVDDIRRAFNEMRNMPTFSEFKKSR